MSGLFLLIKTSNQSLKKMPLSRLMTLRVEAGAEYAVVDASGQAVVGIEQQRVGSTLGLHYKGSPVLYVNKFFEPGSNAKFLADAAKVAVQAMEPSQAPLTSQQVQPVIAKKPVVQYKSAELVHQTQTSKAVDESKVADEQKSHRAEHDDSSWLKLPSFDGSTGLLLGGVGLLGLTALAAGSGSDGGGDGSSGQSQTNVTGVVKGTVMMGPVTAHNDLTVSIYQVEDSVHPLGTGKINADGSFSVAVGAYTGVIYVYVESLRPTVAIPDYLDEATNSERNLEGTLGAVATITQANSETNIQVNPITSLALLKLFSVLSSPDLATSEDVEAINDALAAVFQLGDLHATSIIAVNGEITFDGATLSREELYGALLASISGMEKGLNISQAQALANLAAELQFTNTHDLSSLYLTRDGENALLNGASIYHQVSSAEAFSLPDTYVPIFTSSTSASEIGNNSGAGQTIYQATAEDRGAVTFTKKNTGDASHISVNPTTGAVTLNDNPVYVNKPNYTFTIIATDSSGNTREITVTVNVNNPNIDTSKPVFSSASNVSVSESVGVTQPAYIAVATDNSVVTYSLENSGDRASFNIDASNGRITFVNAPSYAVKSSYTFTIVATDSANNQEARTVTLTITPPVDTSKPVFSSAAAVTVDESIGTNQAAYTAVAVDNGVVSYRLADSGDQAAFNLDGVTGRMTFKNAPSYAAKSSYTFTVIATDSANNQESRTVSLSIKNPSSTDNTAPVFISANAVSVEEQVGTSQAAYTAVATDNSTVTYRLAASGDQTAFNIDSATGVMTFKSAPSYATKSSYIFTVIATDSSNNQESRTVSLLIKNPASADTTAPVFASASAVSVDEAIGTSQPAYTAVAVDNSTVRYSFADSGDRASFDIDSTTGNVTFKHAPSYANQSSYRFTVIATDSANNQQTQTVSLLIKVPTSTDTTKPVFTSAAVVSVDERIGTSETAYTAVATDNSAVTYRLLDSGDQAAFHIDSTTGRVTFQRAPSYAAKSSYTFTVIATDSANNQESKTVNLLIKEPNSTDTTAPVFTSGSAVSVDENISSNTVIYQATASDDSTITYRLLSVGDASAFNFDAHTGNVTFRSSPNYEAKSSYRFTLSASDLANNVTEKTVTVSINNLDEGDATIVVRPTILKLEAVNDVSMDSLPNMAAVGSSGQYVLAWQGTRYGYNHIYVQRFNADNTPAGGIEELSSGSTSNDYLPQLLSIGSSGNYLVAWHTETHIYVQHFNADGSLNGAAKVVSQYAEAHDYTDFTRAHMSIKAAGDHYIVAWAERSEIFSTSDPLSIYVQKFDGNGASLGSKVILDGSASLIDNYDYSPVIQVLNSSGEFVVAWSGVDTGLDSSIFVQRFNANGSTAGNKVMLEPSGHTGIDDVYPEVCVLADGAYIVSWQSQNSDGYLAAYMQRFSATGSAIGGVIQLDGVATGAGNNTALKVTALGSAGASVAVWAGTDGDGDYSIFVQRYGADMSATGDAIRLEASDLTSGIDMLPIVTQLGNSGEFVVVWHGQDAEFDSSVYVQKFTANGTRSGDTIKLEATSILAGQDHAPQVLAVGNTGKFIVSWAGQDQQGDLSIYTQPFNAQGQPDYAANQPDIALYSRDEQVAMTASGSGTLYLVNDTVTVTNQASITTQNDQMWNQLTVSGSGGNQYMSLIGLAAGDYHAYFVNSQNQMISAASSQVIRVIEDNLAPHVSLLGPANKGVQVNGGIGSSALLNASGDYVTALKLVNSAGNSYEVHSVVRHADGRYGDDVVMRSSGVASQQYDTVGDAPIVRAVGSDGSYVVAWYGADAGGDNTVFVQKIAANASKLTEDPIALEATDVTNKADISPSIVALGSSGEFLVSWAGIDRDGDSSIFLQSFNANGTRKGDAIKVEAQSQILQNEQASELFALSNGSYALSFVSLTAIGKYQYYVQKLSSAGALDGSVVRVDTSNIKDLSNNSYRMAVLKDGSFAAIWIEIDQSGEQAILAQRYYSSGARNGSAIEIDSPGIRPNSLTTMDIQGVGSGGDFVIGWSSVVDSSGNYYSYTQKISANGTLLGPYVEHSAINASMGEILVQGDGGDYTLNWTGFEPYGTYGVLMQGVDANGKPISSGPLASSQSVVIKSTEMGTVFLVNDAVTVSDVGSIKSANSHLWHSADVMHPNVDVAMSLSGLSSGAYHAYAIDHAGNFSQVSNAAINVVETQENIVVFDLVSGVSSSHSERTFRDNVDYSIYIRVESNGKNLSTDGYSEEDGRAIWNKWSGADKLGSGDKIYLVGADGSVFAKANAAAGLIAETANKATWANGVDKAVVLGNDGKLQRFYSGANNDITVDLWSANAAHFADLIQANVVENFDRAILISQGLA